MTLTARMDAPAPQVLAWLAKMTGWRAAALAAAAGAVATLGHAPFFVWPAFVVAIMALVWLIDVAPAKRRIAAGFARGWAFGFGHFLSGLHWVQAAFLVDAETFGSGLGLVATVALAAGLALFWGVGCAAAAALWTRDWRRIAAFAAMIGLTEIARGHLFGGFPWLLPAYIWEAGGAVSQTAAVLGAYGLSAVTLVLAASPACAADAGGSPLRRFTPMLVAALTLGLMFGLGVQRLSLGLVALPGATPVVRVADPGLGQAEKWSTHPDDVLAAYLDVSGTAEESRADYVIWPEGAIPAQLYSLAYGVTRDGQEFALEPARGPAIAERLGDRVLIAGTTRCSPMAECLEFFNRQRGAEGLVFHNSAVAIDGVSGVARLAGVYDKHRLTPFGEFIPFWGLISSLNIAPLQQIGAGFTPGPEPTRLVIDAEARPVAVQICYESIFPGFTPRGAGRPGWIVNISNDAWFGGGSGPAQHFNIARYRAIEEGLPIARAASGGASAIIDAYGRAVGIAPVGVGFVEKQLPMTLPPTPFARFGWMLVAALFAALLAMRFLTVSGGRRP